MIKKYFIYIIASWFVIICLTLSGKSQCISDSSNVLKLNKPHFINTDSIKISGKALYKGMPVFSEKALISSVSLAQNDKKIKKLNLIPAPYDKKMAIFVIFFSINQPISSEVSSFLNKMINPFPSFSYDKVYKYNKDSLFFISGSEISPSLGLNDTLIFEDLITCLDEKDGLESLVVFIVDHKTISSAQDIKKKFDNISEKSVKYGLYYNTKIKKPKRHEIHDFTNTENDYQFKCLGFNKHEQIEEQIRKWLSVNSQINFNLIFKPQLEPNLRTNYIYNLSLDFYDNTLMTKFNYEFPFYLIRANYLDHIITRTDSFIILEEYADALRYLKQKGNEISSDTVNNKIKNTFINWATSIETDNSDNFNVIFGLAEDLFKFKPESCYWYKKIKIDLWNGALDRLPKGDTAFVTKLELLKKLYDLQPDNVELKYNIYYLEACIKEKNRNYLEALLMYEKARLVKENKDVIRSIIRCVQEGLLDSYLKKDYNTIVDIVKLWPDQSLQNFEMRIFYGEACRALGNYKEAYEVYDWILLNWRDTPYLNWDNALKNIENLLTSVGEFDKAIALNQRIYRKLKNPEVLLHMVINIRLKYLSPVVESINRILKRPYSKKYLNDIFKRPVIKTPEFIKSFYLLDSTGNIITKFYEKEYSPKFSKRNITSNDPYLTKHQTDSLTAYIFPVIDTNQYLWMDISHELNHEESVYIDNIIDNPESFNVWNNYLEYEYIQLSYLFSRLFTAIMEQEVFLNNKIPVYYWSVLNKTAYVSYILLHDKEGEIIQSFGKNIDQNSYAEYDWKRSSITQALYRIDLENNNSNIIEFTNPIYSNGIRTNAVRVGFTFNK